MVTFGDLGATPVINASTTLTVLGGSLMPDVVLDAMRDAAGAFIDMHDLQMRVGAEIARLTGNEAALVTGGCAAAIVLAVLGARAGADPRDVARLTDGGDLPDEVLIHAAHRIPYDPAVRLAGARLRTVGNVQQTFPFELEAAISDRTAALLYVAGTHLPSGALPLEDVVRICHARGVPVIVDAAAQLPPVENLWRFTKDLGADVALFSGGKALRGPQASGLIVGTEALVTAARANAAPHQRLARAMKVGKEEIAGLLAAVERYLALDHAAEHARWLRVVGHWAQALEGVAGVRCTIEQYNEAGQPVPRLRLDLAADGPSAGELVARLWNAAPRIAVLRNADAGIWIGPDLVTDDEIGTVADGIAAALTTRTEGATP